MCEQRINCLYCKGKALLIEKSGAYCKWQCVKCGNIINGGYGESGVLVMAGNAGGGGGATGGYRGCKGSGGQPPGNTGATGQFTASDSALAESELAWLEELNREMVEVLEMMVKIFKPKYDMQAITSVETITIANAEYVLAKAGEGEGE